MPYVPTQPPANLDLDGLRKWVEDEFRNVARAAVPVDSVVFRVVSAIPTYAPEGIVVFADGSKWNPGSGRGLYQKLGAAWVKL